VTGLGGIGGDEANISEKAEFLAWMEIKYCPVIQRCNGAFFLDSFCTFLIYFSDFYTVPVTLRYPLVNLMRSSLA
jgi:hypothetical protein